MPLPYNLDFPQAVDFMRDSQPLMLTNYASIFTFIGTDHAQFNTANAGDHNQMTFPIIPEPPTPNNNNVLVAAFNEIGNVGNIALFIMNAAGVISGFSNGAFSDPVASGEVNFIQLPSGLILKWAFIPATTIPRNPQVFQWSTHEDPKPFTTQYWAIVIPNSYGFSTDISGGGQLAYVISVSNPDQITYNVFQRAGMLIGVRPIALYPRIVFAIGV